MQDSVMPADSYVGISQADAEFSKVKSSRSWLVVLSAALFFFYEFIQGNMFNAISGSLIQAFSLNAAQLGSLSSYYFIANVLFLIPAGMFLDRCGTRKVILTSLAVCIIGTICLAFSYTIFWASVCRFLTGIGSAFCFLSVIRLASRWFPAKQMAFVTGVVVTMAMLGGMVAQTPMALLVNILNWRTALLIDGIFGVVIFLWIALFVIDFPPFRMRAHKIEQQQIRTMGYWKSMRLAFLRMQNWLAGIYASLLNLPLSLLGGLWGVMYLVDAHGISKIDATVITSMLFVGMIIGSPLCGWLSDTIGRRKPPIMVGGIISLALLIYVVFTAQLSFSVLLVVFFLIGISTSVQIISYPIVAESSPRMITAMSVSVVNISVQGGIALFQPLFGRLIDLHVYHRLHHFSYHFNASDFKWAMLLFVGGIIISLLASVALEETFCRTS